MKMFCHVNLKHVIIFVVTELETCQLKANLHVLSIVHFALSHNLQELEHFPMPKSQFKEMNAI